MAKPNITIADYLVASCKDSRYWWRIYCQTQNQEVQV